MKHLKKCFNAQMQLERRCGAAITGWGVLLHLSHL